MKPRWRSQSIVTVGVALLLAWPMASCVHDGVARHPLDPPPPLGETSVDALLAALPPVESLPTGFTVTKVCPTDDTCGVASGVPDIDALTDSDAMLVAHLTPEALESAESTLIDTEAMRSQPVLAVWVWVLPDHGAALAVRDELATHPRAAPTTPTFDVPSEPLDDRRWSPGHRGTSHPVAIGDHEVTGQWRAQVDAAELSWTLVSPSGNVSALYREARLVVVADRVVVKCTYETLASLVREDEATAVCQDLVAGTLGRLGLGA